MRDHLAMRPSPRPPLERRLVTGLLIAALQIAPLAQAQNVRLPTLGDSVSGELDLITERKLGDQVMREVRSDPDVLDDALLLAYVESLWRPLVKAARERGDIGPDTERAFAWEPLLVRDRSVNAFALPGGYVGVHLGLIAATATRDELAAVLAHELAHVTQRHIARQMTNTTRQSMVALASMIAGLVVASKARDPNTAATAAQAAVIGGQALAIQGYLNFSREMEREADRVGFGIFDVAAFAPAGVAGMFEKLEAANRLNDSGGFPYLRTHPLSVERIGDARARVEAQAAGAAREPRPTLDHELMRARARVLMDPRETALRQHAAGAAAAARTAASPRFERVAAPYAAAVAALQLREPTRALEHLDAAQGAMRTGSSPALNHAESTAAFAEPALRLTQAEALARSGQAARALALIDTLPDTSRPALLTRATLAVDAARDSNAANTQALRSSVEALQSWVADHRQDAAAWALLARGSEALGLRLRAVRADAEARFALGDLRGAIDRLRSGQRMARDAGTGAPDAIEASVIDVRVRDLLALHRELYPDARIRP
jgi:beta-barrel assembly-enhancing protease